MKTTFQPRRRGHSAYRQTLRFESLEERFCLSGLAVTTISDIVGHSGTSLRDAIVQANADSRQGTSDTIRFDASLSGQTITLSQGQLELGRGGSGSGAITIDGSGLTSPIVVSGNNAGRVFLVDSGVQASIAGLTIQGGRITDANGAGIANSGTLAMTSVTVINNSANPSSSGAMGTRASGGGIENFGTMTVTASRFVGNSAGSGGGIDNSGTLTLTDSQVAGNSASSAGGGIENSGMLRVLASTIATNSATSGLGGGIGNGGTMEIANSTITSNVSSAGGGVYSTGVGASLVVSGCTFASNQAAGVTFVGGSNGGGIYTRGGALIVNSTFVGNSAHAVMVGAAYGNGGAIYGDATIIHCTISGNSASAPTSQYYYVGGAGGGLYLFSSLISSGQVLNTIVSGNSATGGGPAIQIPPTLLEQQSYRGLPNGSSNNIVSPVNPNLGPLQDNGGPTQTMALLPGSVAIGTGAPAILTVPCTASDTTLVLPGLTGINGSTPADVLIKVDSEQIRVTSISSSTVTVIRGYNGSTAAPHNVGAPMLLATDQRGVNRSSPTEIGAYQIGDVAGDTLATANGTGLGPAGGSVTSRGHIGDGKFGSKDVDFYSFQAPAGSKVTIQTTQPAGGAAMDTYLRLFDAGGHQLASNDDSASSRYSLISNFNLANAGTYYVGVSGYPNSSYNPTSGGSGKAGATGDYQLSLTLVTPPEIDIAGNGVSIGDGDTTPSTSDGTDFGSQDISSGSVTRTFTIANQGSAALNLTGTPRVQISGANAGDFSVSVQPASSVAGGGLTTFQIVFDPTAAGARTATVTIANDDSDESLYDFKIQGMGLVPEIDVAGNGVSIADGDTTPTTSDGTDFGSQDVASGSVTRTFTITNTGPGTLNLTGTPRVQITGANAGDFSVSVQPASSVAAGGLTTFQIVFDPTATGLRKATVTIANDDINENPYDFAIQGTGTLPEIDVTGNCVSIPDGDTTPSPVDGTEFGSQDVSSGSVTRTFTITNTGPGTLNLNGTPRVQITGANAGDFSVSVQPASSVAAGGSTTFQIVFDPTAAGLRTATVTIANDDSDESLYDFAMQGTGTVPEIDITGNSVSIPDGGTTPSTVDGTDFGSQDVASGSVTHTFTITNTGPGTLNLSGTPRVKITGANYSDFTVSVQPSSSVAPGSSTSFQIVFDPSAAGLRKATVTIANDDSDESPYDFAIQGMTPVTIDDGDVGFTTTGTWDTKSNTSAYQGDQRLSRSSSALDTAIWNFNTLPSGDYQVMARWVPASGRLKAAPYSIYNNSQLLSTVNVNQRNAPSGVLADGFIWQNLGTVSIASGTLNVVLTDNASGTVSADAVRIVRTSARQPVAPIRIAETGAQLKSLAAARPLLSNASVQSSLGALNSAPDFRASAPTTGLVSAPSTLRAASPFTTTIAGPMATSNDVENGTSLQSIVRRLEAASPASHATDALAFNTFDEFFTSIGADGDAANLLLSVR
jgi:hypothetical protein